MPEAVVSEAVVWNAGRRYRHRWPVAQKLEIVRLAMMPGASIAEVARTHGVNANQVFSWRRAYQRGELNEPCGALIPVRVTGATSRHVEATTVSNRGSIHIEFPGRALISVESGADPSLLRSILESLRK
jgi:transposase